MSREGARSASNLEPSAKMVQNAALANVKMTDANRYKFT